MVPYFSKEPKCTNLLRRCGLLLELLELDDDALLQIENNPVVALNRAVAIGRRDGAPAGLLLVEDLLADLPGYQGVYAAAADLSRRAGQQAKARRYYRQAIELTRQSAQKLWLQRRLAELESPGP